MDKQKLLEYAQYGCAQKMNDYRILAEKQGECYALPFLFTYLMLLYCTYAAFIYFIQKSFFIRLHN